MKLEGSLSRLLTNGSEREDIVVKALQECQQALDAVKPIDRSAILAKYPEIRDELSACLDGLALVQLSQHGGKPDQPSAETSGFPITPSATLGDFQLQNELGRGGMGVVYEAEQLSVGRKVALKVLPYAAMLDKRQIARFQNEARAAATLEHPHIVPVYFVGNERGVYYYAMRLIDGRNLAEVMGELRGAQEDDAPLSQIASQLTNRSVAVVETTTDEVAKAETIREQANSGSTHFTSDDGERRGVYFESVARLGVQMAEALEYAHSHGIIHRDVKPANIMLDSLGDAWITDFGLARIESDAGMTMTGDLVGTLRYMAPEQTLAQRITVDHRSDVYSLGATLYELLTLSPVFDGEDRASLLHKIAFVDPKLPSKIDSAIPKDLETIVLKTLNKNPEDRYSSSQELAADLNRFLSHQPVLARRTPISQRIRMWGRRHPALVGSIAAVAAVVLLATAVLGFMMAKHERTLRSQEKETADQISAALVEKEDALEAANANLGEALNAIDRFLVELSDDRGKAIPGANLLREDLIRSAFEIYDNLEKNNQMTPEVERRKLMALSRACQMPRILNTAEGVRLHDEALALANRILRKSPHDVQAFFLRLVLLARYETNDYEQTLQRTRDIYQAIRGEVEHYGSTEALLKSQTGQDAHIANALLWAQIRSYSNLAPLSDEEWRYLRDVAVVVIKKGNAVRKPALAANTASVSYRLGDKEIAMELIERVNEISDTKVIPVSLISLVEELKGEDAARDFGEEQLRRLEARLVRYPKAERAITYSSFQAKLADYLAKSPNLEAVVAQAEEAARKKHPLIRRNVMLGCLYRHLGDTENEIRCYERAAATNFGVFPVGGKIDDRAYAIYLSKGEYTAAIDVYADSKQPHEQKRLAAAQFKAGLYEPAVRSIRKAFDLNPNDVSTITWVSPNSLGSDSDFQNPAWIKGRKALLEYMVERYDDLIKSQPGKGSYWHGRAVAKKLLGHLDEALEDNIRAAELRSTDKSGYAYCLLHLSNVYAALGRDQEETETLLKAVEARERDKESEGAGIELYLNALAASYAKRRMFAEAKATQLRIFELEPTNSKAHNNTAWRLATSHIAEGRNGDLSVKLATKACELTDWKNAGFLDTLAAAYAQSGDFKAAVQWQAKAIELAPANVKEELRSRLDLYEQKKPYRVPH